MMVILVPLRFRFRVSLHQYWQEINKLGDLLSRCFYDTIRKLQSLEEDAGVAAAYQ